MNTPPKPGPRKRLSVDASVLAGLLVLTLALGLWVLQLALNAVWSQLFFGLRRPGLALIDLGALLIAVAATIWAFWRYSPVAAGLLAPYLAWTAYAFALNAAIVWMNP